MYRDRAVRMPDRVLAALSQGGHVPARGNSEEVEIRIRCWQQERKLGTLGEIYIYIYIYIELNLYGPY